MSEVEIKKNEKKEEALASKVLSGFKGFFDSVSTPWVYSATVIDILNNHNFDYEELIKFLTAISRLNYNEFKQAWDNLSEEKRKKAIDIIISGIADLGLESLFMAIANSWEVYEYPDVRLRIMRTVKDYQHTRIKFYEMAKEIEDIFWPNEKIKEKEKENIDNYWKGMKLKDYADIGNVLGFIQKYLIDKIGAIGENPNLGKVAP